MNNFAVSSDGIATALQDSASALMEGGNNLEQAVALVAAANKVVQDPNSVGSALRTIALRLRGTSVKLLEEMGEETDGAIESVSKLQKKLKELTGVDIIDANGAYKDTYTILRKIGEVWKNLDPIDQAAALELMAGKNRANTLAAILNNMEDLEDAYKSALDAEGSALKENEAYLDSIQGRIDLFTNSLQTLWMNLLDTSVIKGVVNAGTTLIKFLDTLAGKLAALAAVPMLYNKLKHGTKFADMFKGAITTIVEVGKALKGLTLTTSALDNATVSQAIATRITNKELAREILINSGLSAATGNLTAEQIKNTAATLSEAFANGNLSASQYLAAMSTMGLKTALQGLWNVLKANPLIIAAAAITAAAWALDKFNVTAQEAADAAKEAFDEINGIVDSTKSTIQNLESELSTIGDKIDSLDGKQSSFVKNEEIEKLKKQREELEHSLKVQKSLLELQKQSQAKQAIQSMKAYIKTTSEGAEKTQKAWQIAGTILGGVIAIGGIAASVLVPGDFGTIGAAATAIGSKIATGGGLATIAAGAYGGNKLGEIAGSAISSNEGTYDSWYETYTKALETAREDEQKALKNYEKDSSNIDKLDKWREAQKKVTEIETEMYDHLSQMQQYYNGLEYGKDPEIDKELDAWNNFLDKMSISEGASGAEVTALDRIFGENASEEIKDIKKQIQDTINKGEEFDFESAINGSTELSGILSYLGLKTEDVKNYFIQVAAEAEKIANISINDVYSTILSSIEAFNEMQKQSSEIIQNNMKISEDYYNALKDQLDDVTVGEEGFTDAIDTSNGYIVKNAALLKKLIAQSKNAQRATIGVAKAQAQLEYKDVVSQIRDSVSAMATEYKAYGFVTDATFDNISAMREQLQALKQTIQQYALLEISLSGAVNAYEEYEKAKERDTQLTYDDSFIEMLQTIDQGILKNETGTEAFEHAVKAIVPEQFWKDIDDVDEKIRSIHDYIDGDETFAKLFTVDEESGNLDITADNVREFIKMAEEAKLVVGGPTGFSLSDDVEGVEDFAKELGITEAAALALLSATEKVDAKWGNILTDITTKPLEREVNSSVGAVDKATIAIEDFWKEAVATGKFNDEEYQKLLKQLEEANKKLEEDEQAANDNARMWSLCQSAISSYRGELKLTEGEVDELAKSLGFVDEKGNPTLSVTDDGTLQLTDEQMASILAKLGKLEEPAIMRVQLRYDEISSEIDQLQKYINKGCVGTITIDGITIDNHVDAQKKLDELTPEKKEIEYTYKITETSAEHDKSVLESYQELAKNGVEFTVTANVKDAKEGLEGVTEEQGKIKENQEIKITSYAGVAQQAIKDVADQLARLESKSITLTVDVKKTETDDPADQPPALNPHSSLTPGLRSSSGIIHALGNAMATGNAGLKSNENDAVVGELGPEMVIDPLHHRYYTVGENGTEMVNLPRGAIIYNHKQTEELLKNGHTTRGHYTGGISFATGSAYGDYGIPSYRLDTENSTSLADGDKVNEKWDDAVDKTADAAEDFAETLDWIEIRLEEINEQLSLKNAQLENAVGPKAQNAIINDMISLNEVLYENLLAGANEYYAYAKVLLAKVPEEYRMAAQNGAIAIEQFVGEVDEETLKSIQEYREWVQKGDDATQQAEETITEIRTLAKQAFDNIADKYENKNDLRDAKNEKIEAAISLDEEKGLPISPEYYEVMAERTKKKKGSKVEERDKLQAQLDKSVKNGKIPKYSQDWYDAVSAIYALDKEIIECDQDLESFQNSINDIYWDNFEEGISRTEYLEDETQSLIDLMGKIENPVDKDGNWTDEGIASLGLYAQQMEIAEYKAQQYADAIDQLNADYAAGKYSESEYLEKLNELKKGQHDSIQSYYDAQDAIKDLQKTRVDAIKNGIEEEIDAYDELISKKKEELSAEKDLYDFQKSSQEHQKNIADIERKLAALAGDNSASAVAKRKQLEAELAEAKAEQEDFYYNRSVENQQNALDKESEAFQESKQAEMDAWDEWLENTDAVMAESLAFVQANADTVYSTLNDKATEYGLTLSDTVVAPWESGALAIDGYDVRFGESVNTTTEKLAAMQAAWQAVIAEMNNAAAVEVQRQKSQNYKTEAAKKKNESKKEEPKKEDSKKEEPKKENKKSITVGGKVKADKSAKIYSSKGATNGSKQYFSSDPKYTVLKIDGSWVQVRHHSAKSGVTGWFKKSDLKAYAKGTMGVNKDQVALIDELGEELVLHAGSNGKLEYLSKGSGVVPADLTERLVNLAIDPQEMLDRNRPQIAPNKNIINTEINLDCSVGTLVNIEHCDQSTLPDVEKLINKAFEKHMQNLNNSLKRFVR